jgi:hypothetical protein
MIRVTLVVAAVLLAGCEASSGDAPTAPLGTEPLLAKPEHQQQWVPLSFTVANACTGESIAVSGRAHLTTRIRVEADRVLIRGHTNLNLTGLGLSSGRSYRLHQITNTDVELDVTLGGSTTQQVFHLSMISAGPMPNARVTMNGTVFLDPAGNSTVIPKKWEVACK